MNTITEEVEARRNVSTQPEVAVLIPCYNEEMTIAEVVRQFRDELPDALIYVFDNNSSDRTVEEAHQAGAIVLRERRQGKGHVVQSMFGQVEADIYIMVDGDGTYPPGSVHQLIAPILSEEADMVVGSRLQTQSQSQFKYLNRFGNRLFLRVLNFMFKVELTDILSGYRAFNRKFVKGIPLFGGGFEIETEMTIKAIDRFYRIIEVPVKLSERPQGSLSKIQLARDGILILNTILVLFRDYKPLTFFGAGGLVLIATAFIPAWMVIVDFINTGLVLRLPSAILAVGLVLSGMLLIAVGLVLHTIARRSRELNYQLCVLTDQLRYNKAQMESFRREKTEVTVLPF